MPAKHEEAMAQSGIEAASESGAPLDDVGVRIRIARETPDGAVRALLEGLYGHDLRPLELSEVRHHSAVTALQATAATAASAATTYLSIKAHPSDVQPQLLRRLDPEQEARYDVLADVIDEICEASPLQRLVAWSAIQVAFSSRYATRFLDDLHCGNDLAPRVEEQPDARLTGLLDTLGGVDLQEVLAERFAAACARVGLQPWDLQDELGWPRRDEGSAEVLDTVERELDAELHRWLVSRSELPVLTRDERRGTLGALLAWRQRATAA